MPNHTIPVNVISIRFLRYYWITMRPYLLFISGITGIAGMSFATSNSLLSSIVLSLVFFFSYGFGQALTDCFQIDTDSISSPYRPLTQGVIRKKDVLMISLTGLILIGIILTAHAFINLFLTSLAILGLATYTYFKKRWWAGPFYNAWIVLLLCLIAFLAGGGDVRDIKQSKFLLLLLSVFFGYANFVLSGYFKDISADRVTGYYTLPVVYGRPISKSISDIFAAISTILTALVLALVYTQHTGMQVNPYSVIFFLAGGILCIIGQIRLHKVQTETDAHRAISPVVHAYILLLSSITSAQKPGWSVFLIIFYLGFVITMTYRPMKAQI